MILRIFIEPRMSWEVPKSYSNTHRSIYLFMKLSKASLEGACNYQKKWYVLTVGFRVRKGINIGPVKFWEGIFN